MELNHSSDYSDYGLDGTAQDRLAVLGGVIQEAGLNITGVKDPVEIEKIHFLDSLSLLKLPVVREAGKLADIGSGGGLPGLLLAIALPDAAVTCIESVAKKCTHIEHAVAALGLVNVKVSCERAEEHARSGGRDAYDVVVSRAVGPLPVVAEYSLPLLRLGGTMVAMKGLISDQEWTHGLAALGILGADGMEMIRLDPFLGARERVACLAMKVSATPSAYPRRAGMPQKRPLGQLKTERTGEARP